MEVKSMGGVGEWDRVSEFGPRISLVNSRSGSSAESHFYFLKAQTGEVGKRF